MLEIEGQTSFLEGIQPNSIPESVIQSTEPVILKQLVKDWPLVKASLASDKTAMDYVKGFYNGRPTIVCKIDPEKKGRLFYSEDLTRLDYTSYKGKIDETLNIIYSKLQDPQPNGYYIASNIIATHLPGLEQENNLIIPRQKQHEKNDETVSIWIGNATTASCHYDALNNIACCVTGRRRFTLFPPDQIENLYPGPLEPTPGGQVVSLVDFSRPNFEKFPKFKNAVAAAQVAELEPGDALFIPSMWWHHVEGLAPFNMLVNYWWNDAPRYLTSGANALYSAMLGIRDRPKHERQAWKNLFDYYIFNSSENANSYIPENARGFLESLDELNARKLRALLMSQLNR